MKTRTLVAMVLVIGLATAVGGAVVLTRFRTKTTPPPSPQVRQDLLMLRFRADLDT